MGEDLERIAERAGLLPEPSLLETLQVQVAELAQFGQAVAALELPEHHIEGPGMPLRQDVAMPVPSDPVLAGLPKEGEQVRLPGVPHAAKRKVAREIRPTRIERVSDGKELQLPSWPPTREDA